MLRYAITDRARTSSGASSLEDALLLQVARMVKAGVNYIQLREKDLDSRVLLELARKLLVVLRAMANPPKLLINSHADMAVAVGADGVHLTAAAGSLTVADVRKMYAAAGLSEPIISISCHTLDEVVAARATGVKLILFGPVFEKNVLSSRNGARLDKVVGEGLGLDQLRLACAAASPTAVLALGGVTAENALSVMEAGAVGVAAIRLFSV
ncbi:MAG TPA: thiamine phosphate synthase [Acidobacteriaceae bacterium]|nr:thiamine phosphate synthase [Acidobacteriaceae bacterium]